MACFPPPFFKPPSTAARDDTDIVQAAVSALEWHSMVPEDMVTVTVTNGWVTLEGEAALLL
jgi:osmotically-inducible protein OsmY